MMKFFKIVILILASLIIGIVLVSYIIWLTYPSVRLNILIMDKTVHDLSCSQHRSFVWMLNNARILKQNGGNYKVADYYGFHPLKPISERQYDIKRITLETVDSLANNNDAVYFSDAYGVYFNEWFRGFNRGGENSVIEGGINQNDYLLLKLMKDKKKLIIGEYNILWGQTSELNRYKTEQIFGIRTTGWRAKYFSSLDTLNSNELVELANKYKNESGKNWDYTGSGIVLVNQNRVVVIDAQQYLNSEEPVIVTPDTIQKRYSLPENIKYTNWIEINSVSDSVKTLSYFKIDLNKEGLLVFEELGLMPEFPAVTFNDKDGSSIYYFAADFSNNKVFTFFSRLANSRKLIKSITLNDQNAFFNDYYFPLTENIMLNYAHKKKEGVAVNN